MKHTNFLVWSGVRAAVPAHLKNLDVTESELECPLEFHCREKKFNPTVCKNKHFYELFVSGKAKVSRGFAKLKEDFGLADSAVSKAFLKVKTVSSEMFIRSFQFKILIPFNLYWLPVGAILGINNYFCWLLRLPKKEF